MAKIHGYTTKVFVDKYNISADSTEVTISTEHPVADVTGFGSASKSYVKGQYSWTVDMRGWFNNRAGTAGAEVALQTLAGGTAGTVVAPTQKLWGVFPEGTAVGSYGYAGPAALTSYGRTIPIGAAVGVTARAQGTANLGRAYVLTAGVAAANATSSVWDNLAATTNGGFGYLWVPGEVAGTVGTVVIQHSTDNATYTDLCTFGTINAAGGGTAQFLVVAQATTVNQYLRTVIGQGTSGSFNGTIVTAFARF